MENAFNVDTFLNHIHINFIAVIKRIVSVLFAKINYANNANSKEQRDSI